MLDCLLWWATGVGLFAALLAYFYLPPFLLGRLLKISDSDAFFVWVVFNMVSLLATFIGHAIQSELS